MLRAHSEFLPWKQIVSILETNCFNTGNKLFPYGETIRN